MESDDTVIEIKKKFLKTQIGVLSVPFQITSNWQDAVPVPEQGDLPERAVDEALIKAHTIVLRHNNAVYSSQAQRHIAEQIDQLYWNSSNPESSQRYLHVLSKDADLTDPANIAELPEEWPANNIGDRNSLENHAQLARYEQLRERLVALNTKRETQQKKLTQLKHLEGLLQPFADPHHNIQPNLATKDSELKAELEKMRMLMARVGGRLNGLNGDSTNESGSYQRQLRSEEDKLAELLSK
ncbi:MAG: hypothetical protein M1834_005590 [Cirrosporium novae-zelandiae]|nr:MAG: hypothetical protein M1834_005590 [Cirrosporium novae-zelandiae]